MLRKRGTLQWPMGWNRQFEGFGSSSFLKAHVAAFLPHNNPSISL
jgi:hypothetical protein